uniref:Uncharacterized protein n=1 Tax=Heterorhabditis bacteriophora TaxID=37862 RepID=A0A1I7X768_HETBA
MHCILWPRYDSYKEVVKDECFFWSSSSGPEEGLDLGCCVPIRDGLWMIIVLFIFTVCVFTLCCLAATFICWMYKCRMFKNAELLREKYRQEEKFKREIDLKLKEISIRRQHYQTFN